ncbi:MAG TPA: T9SS type A sorting domain-containing protein, partial [Saprospiraceae bacterium]|nr:T9SS type A sorting domain-containing protein [Saprospiraceae bacterium]
KINLGSGASTTESLGDFLPLSIFGGTIMDDGTIYYIVDDVFGGFQSGLYRFQFGEGSVNLGNYDELLNSSGFISSGTELFGIGSGQYYVFNGEEIETRPITGLPQDGRRKYIIAANKHLYVIVDQTKVYRSTKPLSYPQFISGNVHLTSNQDCLPDTLAPGLKYWQVKVEGDDYLRITTTNSEGHFSFSVPEGGYTISSQPLNAHWDLCDASYQVAVNESSPNIDQDFQAIVLSSCADLEVDFSTPLLRRCFDNYYSFRVRNTGPQSTLGTTLTVKLDPFFEFTSATIPYTLIGDSILVFDLGVMAINDEISFYIFFKLSCDAELGMEHCLTGTLQDDNECGESRSSFTECQENIGSFDPNDKRTFNEHGEEAETVDKGEYIYYHIRFQNTGTDTAFNIRVIDPLSPKLDLSTLEMLSASQTYTHFISDGPALVVLFDDILLPDSSTNEPASHGFFKFRVKPLPEYDYETHIPNQARIYFDFNEPILTNEVNMIIRQPVGTKDVKDLMDFDVYPNPTNSLLTLTMAERDFNRVSSYEIIDHLGRTITQSSVLNHKSIDVSPLAQGVYNLVLRENQVIVGMRKFVRL